MRYRHVLLAIAAMALPACHANHYSTPRTLPRGKMLHIMAVHAEPLPAMVYVGRIGLADRVDAGIHASVAFNRLDLKYNFFRSKHVDLAVDPSVSWGYEPIVDDGRWKGALPLMLGLNVSPSVTLLVQGGPIMMVFNEPYYPGLDAPPPPENLILSGTVGGGFQVRIKDWLYLQPECSFTYGPYDPQGTYYWPNIGLGLGFGPQPQYDDLKKSE